MLKKFVLQSVSDEVKATIIDPVSDSDSYFEGDDIELFPSERKVRCQCRERYLPEHFILEGEVVSGFNSVILVI